MIFDYVYFIIYIILWNSNDCIFFFSGWTFYFRDRNRLEAWSFTSLLPMDVLLAFDGCQPSYQQHSVEKM